MQHLSGNLSKLCHLCTKVKNPKWNNSGELAIRSRICEKGFPCKTNVRSKIITICEKVKNVENESKETYMLILPISTIYWTIWRKAVAHKRKKISQQEFGIRECGTKEVCNGGVACSLLELDGGWQATPSITKFLMWNSLNHYDSQMSLKSSSKLPVGPLKARLAVKNG